MLSVFHSPAGYLVRHKYKEKYHNIKEDDNMLSAKCLIYPKEEKKEERIARFAKNKVGEGAVRGADSEVSSSISLTRNPKVKITKIK